MAQLTDQTRQELTVQNLIELNNNYKAKIAEFVPSFEVKYDSENEQVVITMMLNGKTTNTIVSKSELAFNSPADQAFTAADELTVAFRQIIEAHIIDDLIRINANLAKWGTSV